VREGEEERGQSLQLVKFDRVTIFPFFLLLPSLIENSISLSSFLSTPLSSFSLNKTGDCLVCRPHEPSLRPTAFLRWLQRLPPNEVKKRGEEEKGKQKGNQADRERPRGKRAGS
jgi:hypothetical protein